MAAHARSEGQWNNLTRPPADSGCIRRTEHCLGTLIARTTIARCRLRVTGRGTAGGGMQVGPELREPAIGVLSAGPRSVQITTCPTGFPGESTNYGSLREALGTR